MWRKFHYIPNFLCRRPEPQTYRPGGGTVDGNGSSRSEPRYPTPYNFPNRWKTWPLQSSLRVITIFKISVCWGTRRCQICCVMVAKGAGKAPTITTLIVIPLESRRSPRLSGWQNMLKRSFSVAIVKVQFLSPFASANSRGNREWGPCYLSSGRRPLVWQRNTLRWPIAFSPKRGWGTCTILGNLFHSSFAIDPSMQREPGARDSTTAAPLNCAAPTLQVSLCGRLATGRRGGLLRDDGEKHRGNYNDRPHNKLHSCVNNTNMLFGLAIQWKK